MSVSGNVKKDGDLISRSALLEKVQFRLPIDNYAAEVTDGCVKISRRLIAEAPAVDAVEVVRCKDCEHYIDRKDISKKCCYVHLLTPHIMPEDGFCSYGERRGGE